MSGGMAKEADNDVEPAPDAIPKAGVKKIGAGAQESLKRKAYHSAFWTVVGFGASSVLRLASSLILTRLLVPQAMGLMGLVTTIVQGFVLFTDVGVGYSIIKEKRGNDPAFLNTAWTMQSVRGFILWGIISLAAWPVQGFYKREQLAALLIAAGFEVALSGLNSTLLIVFRRNLELHRTVMLQIMAQVVGLVSTVLFALWLRNVWAFVYASWLTAIYNVAVSHYLNRQTPNRIQWDWTTARQIMRVGPWILCSTMLTYLSTQLDKLMLGKMLPLAIFGTYTIATTMVEIPRTLLGRINNMVIFPVVSRRADLPRPELRAKLMRHRWPALMAMGAGIALMAGTGDLIIRLLYDKRYHDAAWIMPMLVLGLWPRAIMTTVDGAMMALGRLHYNPIGSLIRLAAIGLGLPLANRYFGLPGVVVMVAMSDLFNLGPSLYGRWRNGLSTSIQDLQATAFILLILAVVLGIRLMLGLGLPTDAIPPFVGVQP